MSCRRRTQAICADEARDVLGIMLDECTCDRTRTDHDGCDEAFSGLVSLILEINP